MKTYKKPSQGKEYVETIQLWLNEKANGGEAVFLEVDVFDNGDKENNVYTNTALRTFCYGTSSCEIRLGANISPQHISRAMDALLKKLNDYERGKK